MDDFLDNKAKEANEYRKLFIEGRVVHRSIHYNPLDCYFPTEEITLVGNCVKWGRNQEFIIGPSKCNKCEKEATHVLEPITIPSKDKVEHFCDEHMLEYNERENGKEER